MITVLVKEADSGQLIYTLPGENQFYIKEQITKVHNRGLVNRWYYETDLNELEVYDLVLRRESQEPLNSYS